MGNLKLSSPWVTLYHEVDALFGSDPDVTVKYDETAEGKYIKLYVEGQTKADAIAAIIPDKKEFGNVTVNLVVVPSNEGRQIDKFRCAFEGNPAVSYVRTVQSPYVPPVDFVVFRNKVVQFYNDEICDINGNKTTLYQDIAKDIFDDAGVFFCTDTEEIVY